jgi:DNA repair photolyase
MCLYCYATSYIGLKKSTPKKNFIKNLVHDIPLTEPWVPINMGTSSDPYPPEEAQFKLTRRALEILIRAGRRILITTKGTIIRRDIDIIKKGNVAVTPTITTLDDKMAKVIEPGAPPPSERLEVSRKLIQAGIPVGVRVDPIIPYVNDDEKEIEELIGKLAEIGVKFVVTSTYKAKPDNLARMRRGLGELGEKIYRLYRDKGIKLYGYLYLPEEMRKRILSPVIRYAKYYGMEYATCREGLTTKEWFNAPSCDGTHLIPLRLKPKREVTEIDRWLDDQD